MRDMIETATSPYPYESHRHAPRRFLWLLIGWSIAVLVCFGVLIQYSYAPGNPGEPLDQWPTATALDRSRDRATLLMFVHPHCPCSRASLEELGRLLARAGGLAETRVVFVRPGRFPSGWEETDLWSAAVAMPAVRVSVDVDGVEARRFGVATSGSTLLYDGSGNLLFRGGITGARGHAGDNAGKSAVLAGIRTGRPDLDQTSVFGCSLFDQTHECAK